MKKQRKLASILFLFFFSFRLYSTQIEDLEKKIEDLKARVEEISTETALGNTGILTAKAIPDVEGCNWFVSLDVLRLHPKVGGTEFAYTNRTPSVSLPIKGTTKDIDFNWHWGIRAGVGKQFREEGWDTYLQYMYYGAKDSNSATGTSISTRIPLKGAIPLTGVRKATSEFSLNIHTLDLDLGRNYFISKDLALRPFIGLKSAWVDLKQTTRYSGDSLGVDSVYLKDTSNFWGMGIKFGVNSKWYIYKGFHFYSLLSGAFLYGIFDVDYGERHSLNQNQKISLRNDKHRFSPFARGDVGLGWGQYISDKTKYIEVNLGYEVQYFWRQNQMIKFYEFDSYRYENLSEDVSLQGIVLKARLDF